MIGRHVQRRADVRAKCLGGFQLEARQLQHVPLPGARSLHHRRRRRADVSADLRRDAAGLQDVAGQRRGRGFSVRAGDADDLAFQEPAREFQIADHAHAAARERFRTSRSAGTPGESTISSASAKRSGSAARRDTPRLGDRILIRRAASRSRPSRATTPPPPRRCAPSRPPRLLRLPASSQFQRRQREQRQINPAIQKRVITFDSCQPSCSK